MANKRIDELTILAGTEGALTDGTEVAISSNNTTYKTNLGSLKTYILGTILDDIAELQNADTGGGGGSVFIWSPGNIPKHINRYGYNRAPKIENGWEPDDGLIKDDLHMLIHRGRIDFKCFRGKYAIHLITTTDGTSVSQSAARLRKTFTINAGETVFRDTGSSKHAGLADFHVLAIRLS